MGEDRSARAAWKVSLHGGHSGAFCDHAVGSLEDVLEAAVAAGYHTFGVSEHAPRYGAHLLYAEEVAMGWTVETLEAKFAAYAAEVARLAEAFEGRLVVLRGFEAEAVPEATYAAQMGALRAAHAWDYIVGSVHHVGEVIIDGNAALFEQAMEGAGGLEGLAVAYYRAVAAMIEALRPEVVGHLDLIRKNGGARGALDTPAIRAAADEALDAARAQGCILDLNVAALRKGLDTPYPAPWLVRRATEAGLGFCLGDDSHGPEQVGLGLEAGRRYLRACGVERVSVLTREGGDVVRREVPLE